MATFREIGNSLKDRFDRASRVRVSNDFRGIARNKQKLKKKSVQLETYEKGMRILDNIPFLFNCKTNLLLLAFTNQATLRRPILI